MGLTMATFVRIFLTIIAKPDYGVPLQAHVEAWGAGDFLALKMLQQLIELCRDCVFGGVLKE
jgi:antitoxin component of RelBE/YafQ-DinJ toxin-antitoxin module